jgi:hypothetical protein
MGFATGAATSGIGTGAFEPGPWTSRKKVMLEQSARTPAAR